MPGYAHRTSCGFWALAVVCQLCITWRPPAASQLMSQQQLPLAKQACLLPRQA